MQLFSYLSFIHIRLLYPVFLLGAPAFASANAGVPIAVLFGWPFIFSIIPIICIEWLVYRTRVKHDAVVMPTIVANLLSTIAGIPLAFIGFGLLVFAGVSISDAAVPSADAAFSLIGMHASANTALVVVGIVLHILIAFVVSWVTESWILSKWWKQSYSDIAPMALRAHLYSYAFLIIGGPIALIVSMVIFV